VDAFRQRLASFAHLSPVTGDAVVFSDLDRAKTAALREDWAELPTETRRALVAGMVELGEEKIEFNFHRALKVALRDDDAVVRARAIEGLWEDDSARVLDRLMTMLRSDAAPEVRTVAAISLSRFACMAALDELEGRDAQALLDAFLAEIAQLFLEDGPRLSDEIRGGLERADLPRVQRAAHSLQGAVASFSARDALDAARRLEAAARVGDLAAARDVAAVLEQALGRLNPALAELAAGVGVMAGSS